jgi:hypothetical protein
MWSIGYVPVIQRSISWQIHGSPSYDFWGIKQYARDQWASNYFPTTLTQQSLSSIHIIGGHDEQLRQLYEDFRSTNAFQANLGANVDGYVTYEGVDIVLCKQDNVKIYFPQRPWYISFNTSHYRHAMMHELGHAFGWRNHSPQKTDVMYNQLKGPTTLTLRDVQHIYQIIAP